MNALPLLLAILPTLAAPKTLYFFVGTYTSEQGSKGIYRASLDGSSGKLSEPELAIASSNPSYLAQSSNGAHLYAVHEDGAGSISSYKVGADHGLELLNTQSIEGGAPCDLTLDRKDRNLLTACYTGGYVSCLPVRADGSLDKPSAVIRNIGTGPDKSRQDGSHMHWIDADPANRFLYSCDLGTDKVQVYRYEPKKGAFSELPEEVGEAPPGAGPRHGAFSHDSKFLYVNGEMDNAVSVFKRDLKTGKLERIQTIDTIPSDAPRQGKSTAEIECHPSGKWLYVSNRGHDSITVFKTFPSGHLELVEIKPLGLKTPRGFGIDPSGTWLVAAGQESNDLASFAIDPVTGKLSERSRVQTAGAPVCILFANR